MPPTWSRRALGLLAFSLLASRPAFAGCPAHFTGPTTLATGATPDAMAVGDFDEDGHLDFITAALGANEVTISFGDGTGAFPALAAANPVGTAPKGIVAVDFNKDGHLDVATANFLSGNVSVLLGDGTGALSTAVNYAAGSFPSGIAAADFNGDGYPDLVVTNYNSKNYSILLWNSANGTFDAAVNHSLGYFPTLVSVGDFNNDGHADLAIIQSGSDTTAGAVHTYLGDGSGGFAAKYTFGVISPGGVAVADLDGDGNQDLAVSDDVYGTVAVYPGDGTGRFPWSSTFELGGGARAPVIGDFDGDGRLDVAVTEVMLGGSRVTVLLGDGKGGLSTPGFYDIDPAGISYAMVAGDFDGDGRPDLVLPDANNNRNDIFLNRFTPCASVADAAPTRVKDAAATLVFTVSLSQASTSDVAVDYATADGTAVAGTDYVATSGTLTFAPGSTTTTVAVFTVWSAIRQPSRALLLNLSNPAFARLGRGQAQGTLPGRARGCVPVITVPITLSARGSYCLVQDLAWPSDSGAPITITSDDVTLDLQGFAVNGTSGGVSIPNRATGVLATGSRNVTVRGGTVGGFFVGVVLADGATCRGAARRNVLNVHAAGNTYAGLWVEGGGSEISGNQVTDTGGWSNYGDVVGIMSYDAVTGCRGRSKITGNSVVHTGTTGHDSGFGIVKLAEAGTPTQTAQVAGNNVDTAFVGLQISGGPAAVVSNIFSNLGYGIASSEANRYVDNVMNNVSVEYVDVIPFIDVRRIWVTH